MYAMQYTIALPSDYDMGIIRHRVATKGAALDAFSGLGLKAYLIRERGIHGSPVNAYAPFYLWRDIEGMSRFLCDGVGFGGLVDSFGRPSVRHWMGLGFQLGPRADTAPGRATVDRSFLPTDCDPAPFVAEARETLRARAASQKVHSAALAIDPRSWETVQFALWQDEALEEAGVAYTVLHVSRPHITDLGSRPHS